MVAPSNVRNGSKADRPLRVESRRCLLVILLTQVSSKAIMLAQRSRSVVMRATMTRRASEPGPDSHPRPAVASVGRQGW
jgi:hypothetical protein